MEVSGAGAAPAAAGRVRRATAAYEAQHARFVLAGKGGLAFSRQYSHMYLKRLLALRGGLQAQARKQWPDAALTDKVISLQTGKRTVVIGTLYKEQALKPSVMDEFVDEFTGAARKQERDNYCDAGDSLSLEDESGRTALVNLAPEHVAGFVTGLVVAVYGQLNGAGDLHVHGVLLPGMPGQPARARSPSPSGLPSARRLLLVASGLSVGDACDMLRTELLVDFLLGQVGGAADRELAGEVVRVLIAGGSVRPSGGVEGGAAGGAAGAAAAAAAAARKFAVGRREENRYAQPVKQLDSVLAELASSVPVDVMPGGHDPCNATLPQQPLHRCLFPHSERFAATFRRVTNPYACKVGDVSLLATAGQPVQDLRRCTKGMDSVALMMQTLVWRHVAPTAPDSLACHPLETHDPFVLSEVPHLYISGDQPAFQTSLVVSDEDSKVRSRLVAVPRFHETGLVVLVDLASENLDCTTLHFEGLRHDEPQRQRESESESESERAAINPNPANMELEPASRT
jgi:DNA polymerase delta subunit 2